MLLAVALLIGPGPSVVRARAGMPSGAHRLRPQSRRGPDPLAVASSLDVLAVCLAAGMAVSAAAAATAPSAPPKSWAGCCVGPPICWRWVPTQAVAWSTAPELPAGSVDAHTDALLRLARRSASSGAALADGIAELAEQSRDDAAHAAAAAAERAGVLIAGPLGLCFLPAFVCLGIVPVVAGLAGDVFQSGLL